MIITEITQIVWEFTYVIGIKHKNKTKLCENTFVNQIISKLIEFYGKVKKELNYNTV